MFPFEIAQAVFVEVPLKDALESGSDPMGETSNRRKVLGLEEMLLSTHTNQHE